MEHLPEFIANNMFLCAAFFIVLVLTVRAELHHQASKASELSPTQAIRIMNNETAVIIDVSDEVDYEGAHIKNAINVPIKELPDRLADLQKYKDKAVLTCCKDGKQSNRACKSLKQSDFKNVHSISGGLVNWSESNLPVIRSDKT